MKSRINRMFSLLFAVILCCSLPCFAQAQTDSVEVQLSAYIKLSGTPQSTETYRAKLKSLDSSEESIASVTGAGEIKFSALPFDKVGDYYYTVEQIAGSDGTCTYDSSVYRVHIQITYDNDGKLQKTVAIRKDGETGKAEKIEFLNSYKAAEAVVTTTETTTQASTTTQAETTTAPTTVSETTMQAETTAAETTQSVAPYTGDDSGVFQWTVLFGFGFVLTLLSVTVLCTKKKQEEE